MGSPSASAYAATNAPPGIPILMLTALGSTKDKVSGFNSGADDYLAKPFDLEELLVRIKALLRRSDRAPLSTKHNEILNYGALTLVPERFEAIWFDEPVRLTHLEFELLHCLLQRHGQTVAPSLILKEVWGYEPDDDIETIRVHIATCAPSSNLTPANPASSKRSMARAIAWSCPAERTKKNWPSWCTPRAKPAAARPRPQLHR